MLPELKRSKDRKVTNGVSPNGKTATIANSFGLPSGTAFSCPGATSVCEKVCYAGKLEKIYSGVKNVLLHNWNAVQHATESDTVDMLQNMVNAFTADCDKAAKKGPVKRAFRIHWDGDFFSLTYARAWAIVIAANPDVQFWVYTRSFTDKLNVLPVFDAMGNRDNLAFYLSVDSANVRDAGIARRVYPWVKWAWLAETFADGMADMPVEGKRFPCPENGGRIALISDKGSACIRCGICPDARGDVIFSIRKR
jgi:hypothetical protein